MFPRGEFQTYIYSYSCDLYADKEEIMDESTISKKRKKSKKVNLLTLPVDCIGEFVAFLEDFRVFLTLLCVCKELKGILEHPKFTGSRNITFRIKKETSPCYIVQNYVRKLIVEDTFIEKKRFMMYMKCFPATSQLNISQSRNIDDSCLSHLEKLRELDISSCESINGSCFKKFVNLSILTISRINVGSQRHGHSRRIKFKTFKNLTNLRTLQFVQDPCFLLNPPGINEDLMINFPSVETIYAENCCIGEGQIFKHQRRLRFLDVSGCNGNVRSNLTDDLFKDLRSLIVLKMNGIQYLKSCFPPKKESEKEIEGKLTIEAFKNLYSLEHLEICYNWDLDPNIIDRKTLPNLRILHVQGCNEGMCRKSLKISSHLSLIKICDCRAHKPVVTNSLDHYKLLKKNETGSCEYTCKNCEKCEKCKKTLIKDVEDSNNQKKKEKRCFECHQCNRLLCLECKSGFCELCGESYCKDCRTINYSILCECEYDAVCNPCLERDFMMCGICNNRLICKKCGRKCKTCDQLSCRECYEPQFCSKCERSWHEEEGECVSCFKFKKCHICMKISDIPAIARWQRSESLCKKCEGTCPICKNTICIQCWKRCGSCEVVGCIDCFGMEYDDFGCYNCGVMCKKCEEEKGGVRFCCSEDCFSGFGALGCGNCDYNAEQVECGSNEGMYMCTECAKECGKCETLFCCCDDCGGSEDKDEFICKECKGGNDDC